MNKQLVVLDPLGAKNGMERWHLNFFALASKLYKITILSNYQSAIATRFFTYEKGNRAGSIRSILKMALSIRRIKADHILLAHYGEALNTLLFIPAILNFSVRKRYLLVHDAESTLKSERGLLRSILERRAQKVLLSFFKNIVVHNEQLRSHFPKHRVMYVPLPPAAASAKEANKVKDRTGKFVSWGFMKKSKNFEFIIELSKAVPACTFHIYGTFINDEYRNSFLELLNANQTPNLHFFEGFLEEDKVSNLVASYDAVLLPYLFVTNSGILQTNADYDALSITSDLPAFVACNDLSINLPLNVNAWRDALVRLDAQRLAAERQRVQEGVANRRSHFLKQLAQLGTHAG